MTLPLLLVAAVALFAFSGGEKAQAPAAAPAKAPDDRPPANPGDKPVTQTLRCRLGTKNRRTDQRYIESLFTQAGVNGWYIGEERQGRCTVELRATSLEAAQLQLLNLDEVIYLEPIATV